MFGFGKNTISAEEYGQAVISLATETIFPDFVRGCIGLIDPDFNYSACDHNAFLDKNFSNTELILNQITFYHVALQATCFSLNSEDSRLVIKGGTGAFSEIPDAYNFDTLYSQIGSQYRKETVWPNENFDTIEDELNITPNVNASTNARYLLLNNFRFNFEREDRKYCYSIFYVSCGMAISTMERAFMTIGKNFKIE